VKKHKRSVSDGRPHAETGRSGISSELAVEQERFELTWLDYIGAPVIAALAAVWSFKYVGTSINWDELIYMNLSQYTTPMGYIMNRYGHVYLQKIFFGLANDCINGTRVYWCFQIFFTAVLVYWCAKLLAGRRGYAIGVIAVLMFCMQWIFLRWVGCVFPDYTVMMLVMLGVYVYLAFIAGRYEHRHWFIMLLGTAICMGVLFFGLGVERTGIFRFKRFMRDIGWVCVGMVAGSVMLMLLDQIFMGDAFFSVRPSTIKELLASNLVEYKPKPNMNWYMFQSGEALFGPGLLYLLIGWWMNRENWSRARMVTWLIPVALLVSMKLMWMLAERLFIIGRYFAPAIPVICVWAAQFFKFDVSGWLSAGKGRRGAPKPVVALALVLAAFALSCLLVLKGEAALKEFNLDKVEELYMFGIMPVAATVLVAVGAVSKKRGLTALFVSFLCLFLLVFPPLKSNLKSLKEMQVARKSQYRYGPYRVFKDEFWFGNDVKVLISNDVHKQSWMLGRPEQPKSQCYMFNIFFNQKYDFDQFIDGTSENILKGEYTFALLTMRDWKEISEKHNVKGLLGKYELKPDRRTRLVLLKERR
jgi:hypothetical protein